MGPLSQFGALDSMTTDELITHQLHMEIGGPMGKWPNLTRRGLQRFLLTSFLPAPTWDTACAVTGSHVYSVRQLTYLVIHNDHNFILHTVASCNAAYVYGIIEVPILFGPHFSDVYCLFCRHKSAKRSEYY